MTIGRVGPPRAVETIVRLFLPPVCREHVLGDLCERYRSPGQYLLDAIRTAPLVVASQVGRTIRRQPVFSELCALYVSFLVAGLLSFDAGFVIAPAVLPRLAVPVLAGLTGLILRCAYASPGPQFPWKALLDAAFGAASAWLSQIVLAFVEPAWALPLAVVINGGFVSVPLVATLWTFGPDPQYARAEGTLWGQVHRRSQELQAKVWWASIAGMIALGVFPRFTVPSRSPGLFPVFANVALGAAFLVVYKKRLMDRGLGAEPAPVGSVKHRTLLERQRDTMRYWSAYQRSLLIAMTVFSFFGPLLVWESMEKYINITTTFTVPFVVAYTSWFFIMRRLSHRAAGALQQEIDALDLSNR